MDSSNATAPEIGILAEMARGAAVMAAAYQKLLVEGFEPHEALYLVAAMATGGPKAPPSSK